MPDNEEQPKVNDFNIGPDLFHESTLSSPRELKDLQLEDFDSLNAKQQEFLMNQLQNMMTVIHEE